MKTKLFLESADPLESKEFSALLGDLQGHVITPRSLCEHPDIKTYLAEEDAFDPGIFLQRYETIVGQIAHELPGGSIIASVPYTAQTTADDLIDEGKEVSCWSPQVYPQLPATLMGVEAANMLTHAGFRIAISQVCSQQQAGAVHEITSQAREDDVFVNFDIQQLSAGGCDGRSLVLNVQKMYHAGKTHVMMLMGGVQDVQTLVWGIEHKVQAIAALPEVYRQWVSEDKPMKLTAQQERKLTEGVQKFDYEEIDIQQETNSYTLSHKITDEGIQQTISDWNKLLQS